MIPSFVKEREEQGLGFDLYFAGTQAEVCELWMLDHGSCRLQSQLNDRKNIQRWCTNEHGGKLFIDSGAYTALTLGKWIDPDGYINYINSISDCVTVFAQLDYIPRNANDTTDTGLASWENFLYMQERVKEPDKLVPIYHQSESREVLERMLEYIRPDGTHIPYIGFGALAGTGVTIPQKKAFFSRCFSIIESSSNPNVKVHAMGMTSLSLLEYFPFYSADSTSWIMQGATGKVMTPWGALDFSEKTQYAKNNSRNVAGRSELEKYFESRGVSIDNLYTDYRQRMLCNIMYLTEWSKNYKYKGPKRHKKSLF